MFTTLALLLSAPAAAHTAHGIAHTHTGSIGPVVLGLALLAVGVAMLNAARPSPDVAGAAA